MAKKQREYSGRGLMAESRYQEYLPTLPQTDQDRVAARVDELIADNAVYCDQGNYDHLANMLTAVALYELHRERGLSEDEAIQATGEPMWAYVEKHTAGMSRKLLSKPGMLKPMSRIVPAGFTCSSSARAASTRRSWASTASAGWAPSSAMPT